MCSLFKHLSNCESEQGIHWRGLEADVGSVRQCCFVSHYERERKRERERERERERKEKKRLYMHTLNKITIH